MFGSWDWIADGCAVFRVPETATVLMSGGISFGELNQEQVRNAHARKNCLPHVWAYVNKYPSVHCAQFDIFNAKSTHY